MSKKVFIGVGHGGGDSGAVGNGFREKDLNLAIALACKKELLKYGVTVRLSREKDEPDPLTDEIRECNAFNPDLALDIHNNAGGGDGAEVYHYSKGGASKTLAQNILQQIVATGQNSRGLKTKIGNGGKDYFGFIREIKAPSVIVECAFVDNAKDIQIINTPEKQSKMGTAVARGVLKTLGIDFSAQTANTSTAQKPQTGKTEASEVISSGTLYRVTGLWCNIRKGPGTNYAKKGKVKKGEVYTIMEIKSGRGAVRGWGRLKSGAGWVSLDFLAKR